MKSISRSSLLMAAACLCLSSFVAFAQTASAPTAAAKPGTAFADLVSSDFFTRVPLDGDRLTSIALRDGLTAEQWQKCEDSNSTAMCADGVRLCCAKAREPRALAA